MARSWALTKIYKRTGGRGASRLRLLLLLAEDLAVIRIVSHEEGEEGGEDEGETAGAEEGCDIPMVAGNAGGGERPKLMTGRE